LVFLGRYLTRAPRLMTALRMLKTTFLNPRPGQLLDGTVLRLGLQGSDYLVIALGTAVLLAVEAYQERGGKVRETLSKQRPAVQYLALLIPLLVIFFLGVFRTGYISSEFIYKQF